MGASVVGRACEIAAGEVRHRSRLQDDNASGIAVGGNVGMSGREGFHRRRALAATIRALPWIGRNAAPPSPTVA